MGSPNKSQISSLSGLLSKPISREEMPTLSPVRFVFGHLLQLHNMNTIHLTMYIYYGVHKNCSSREIKDFNFAFVPDLL